MNTILEREKIIEARLPKGEHISDVVTYVKNYDYMTVSLLQRRFQIGYPTACKIIEHLQDMDMLDNVRDESKGFKVIKEES